MRKLKQFEVRYAHTRQRNVSARISPELGGLYLHTEIYTGYTEQEAWSYFQNQGGNVLNIHLLRRKRWYGNSISRNLKLQVLQSISFNCRAGLSPAKAFEQVSNSMLGPQRVPLNDALRSMQMGRSFAESVELMEWYDESTIAILRTGENTGQLAQAIHSAVAHYSRSSDLIKIMIGTVILTSFDLFMAASSIIGTRFGLIPSVKEQGIQTEDINLKEKFEHSLEVATTVNDILLIGTGLISVFAAVILFLLLSRKPALRKQAASILNGIPVIGPLLTNAAFSNSFTILGELVKSGFRIRSALEICRRATRHEGTLTYLNKAGDSLEKGVVVRTAFAIDPLAVSEKLVIQSSNDSQQFSESLNNIAEAREAAGRSLAKRFAMIALIASLSYSGIAVGFSLWVVYIQNSALLGGS